MENLQLIVQYSIDQSWLLSENNLLRTRIVSFTILISQFMGIFYVGGIHSIAFLWQIIGFWGWVLSIAYYINVLFTKRSLKASHFLSHYLLSILSVNFVICVLYCCYPVHYYINIDGISGKDSQGSPHKQNQKNLFLTRGVNHHTNSIQSKLSFDYIIITMHVYPALCRNFVKKT